MCVWQKYENFDGLPPFRPLWHKIFTPNLSAALKNIDNGLLHQNRTNRLHQSYMKKTSTSPTQTQNNENNRNKPNQSNKPKQTLFPFPVACNINFVCSSFNPKQVL